MHDRLCPPEWYQLVNVCLLAHGLNGLTLKVYKNKVHTLSWVTKRAVMPVRFVNRKNKMHTRCTIGHPLSGDKSCSECACFSPCWQIAQASLHVLSPKRACVPYFCRPLISVHVFKFLNKKEGIMFYLTHSKICLITFLLWRVGSILLGGPFG